MPPAVPEFREAVQQHHQFAVFRSRLDDMQNHAVQLDQLTIKLSIEC
jgi:hypothetical protein